MFGANQNFAQVSYTFDIILSHYLKGLFTNFEYITFFCVSTKETFHMKGPSLTRNEKAGCSKPIRLSTVIYIHIFT